MKLHKILLMLLLVPIFGFSFNEEGNFVKQRIINKAYFVKSDAGINIKNSYGNISVSTWDEDKIELDILIKVSGDSEKWVNRRIDEIDVDINALVNLVTAKTIIGESDFYNNGNNNSFEINYIIKIPKNGSVKLNNAYGHIFTNDILGSADINCSYGKIVVAKLLGNSNKIDLAYCPKSTIESIKSGTIEAKYSNLIINEANSLNLDADYTDVVIDDCKSVVFKADYAKLNFKKVNNLKGSGDYLAINIGEISGDLKVETIYGKVIIGLIHEKANNIEINTEYSEISIGFASEYAFDFDLSNKNGNIRLPDGFEYSNKEITNNSKQFSGFYRQKGINKLKISNEYGNINLIKKQ